MREIKFRAWDKCRREYLSAGSVLLSIESGNRPKKNIWYLDTLTRPDAYKERFVIEQYTGLKDKKGNEIFEGDILHGTIKDLLSQGYQNGIVIWGSYGFVIDLQKQPWEPGIGIVGFGSFTDYEVIGNIHEGEKDGNCL